MCGQRRRHVSGAVLLLICGKLQSACEAAASGPSSLARHWKLINFFGLEALYPRVNAFTTRAEQQPVVHKYASPKDQ